MAVCGIFLLLILPGAARAERKVALVVGNSQYKNPSLTLINPKNDVEDVATALRALDFEVIAAEDASKRDFGVALTKFARLASRADAALFFYAGHALQYQGRNYLMPVDSEVEDDVSLRYQLVSLDDVRAAVEQAEGVKIVILDACRNNPIADNLSRKRAGLSRGGPVTAASPVWTRRSAWWWRTLPPPTTSRLTAMAATPLHVGIAQAAQGTRPRNGQSVPPCRRRCE